MKKIITNILALSFLALTVSCSGNNADTSKQQNSSSNLESSSIAEQSSSSLKSSSIAPSSSSLRSSSSAKSSSSKASNTSAINASPTLSTTSGLKVSFKPQGASIDKITWGNSNKQIANNGFVVGRCANRIANGKFTLNGTEYNVTKNSGNHSLHGGNGSGMNSWRGPFATNDWTVVESTSSSVTYSFHSPDKDNGYPGNMDMTVKYTLSEQGELSIEYRATSDKDTLCNPTNHLFMALNGSTNSYSNIKLMIDADNYTPLQNQIPTGAISPVENTQFDYRNEKTFDGSKNYDDNYVLNGTGYRKVASMSGTSLGVKVDVYTDRPGLQLYKDGSGSICLETQMFPDMINQPTFADYGTTILRANEEFYSKTTYVFSAI